jgi:hypothetical protein
MLQATTHFVTFYSNQIEKSLHTLLDFATWYVQSVATEGFCCSNMGICSILFVFAT